MSLRADKSEAKEVDFKLSTATYTAEEYALKILLSDREKDNADSALRLQGIQTAKASRPIDAGTGIRVGTLLTTGANWATGHTTSPSTKWDAASGVTIEANIDTAKEAVRKAIGVLPNTLVIPASVAVVVKKIRP